MRKVLVCGSTGFIGRNIAESLADRTEYEVYGTYFRSLPLDHPRIRPVYVDLADKHDVARAVEGMDIVIQAAATTSGARDIVGKPYVHVTDNAVMNALIFRQAFECRVGHVVFLSCSTMYPSSKRPLKETDFDANAEIFSGYFGSAWTKIYNEKICQFFSTQGKTRWTVVRHSNVYGPYDKFDLERSHVFGATVTKVLNAEPAGTIMVWGSGSEARDLLYVTDLTDFVHRALDRQDTAFEIFNVGSGQAIPIKDLVKKIIEHSGKALKVKHDLTQPTIKTSLCLDCAKALRVLGWQPQVALDEGISRTLAWYREYRMEALSR